MAFLETMNALFHYGAFNPSLFLFVGSTVLLIVSIAIKVWSDAVNLAGLQNRSLTWIERTHPHLPSLQAVVVLNFCTFALLAVALQTMLGVFPFNDPYSGINLVTLFVLSAAVGTLAELRCKGAQAYAYAFILGTSIAFVLLAVFFTTPPIGMAEKGIVSVLAFFAAIAAWRILGKGGNNIKTALAAIAVFLFWVLIYVLQ